MLYFRTEGILINKVYHRIQYISCATKKVSGSNSTVKVFVNLSGTSLYLLEVINCSMDAYRKAKLCFSAFT